MHIENMHAMIECLVSKSKAYMDNGFEGVDSEELSKATDAIKDLCEAYYYASVSKAMEESKEEEKRYYSNYNAVKEPARMTYDIYNRDYNKEADWNRLNSRPSMNGWDDNDYSMSKQRYMNAIDEHTNTHKPMEEYTKVIKKDINDMCNKMTDEEKTEFKTEMAHIVNAM